MVSSGGKKEKKKGSGDTTSMDVDTCSKDKNVDVNGDDQGLYFYDIILSGGEHLDFGTFQNMKIQRLWTVHHLNNKELFYNERNFTMIEKNMSRPSDKILRW